MTSPIAFDLPYPRQALSQRAVVAVVAALVLASTLLTPAGRERLIGWVAVAESVSNPPRPESVFVSLPTALTPEQARTARWIAKRHRVALAATSQIVQVAFEVASSRRLDPYLVLAVISVESGFNPLAESHVGAKGLMQIMPQAHGNRFQGVGGVNAALDPFTNIQVGADILREYIDRFRSVDAALVAYVGAAPGSATEYPARVMRIRERMFAAAMGRVLADAETPSASPS